MTEVVLGFQRLISDARESMGSHGCLDDNRYLMHVHRRNGPVGIDSVAEACRHDRSAPFFMVHDVKKGPIGERSDISTGYIASLKAASLREPCLSEQGRYPNHAHPGAGVWLVRLVRFDGPRLT